MQKRFIKAYERLGDDIFRYCYFRLYDRERARDMTQEVFMRAWKYLSAGNDVKNLRALLYRVARNAIIDISRKKHEYSLDDLQEKGFEPKDSQNEKIIHNAEMALVKEALLEIDVEYREVVIMRYINGLSPKDISEITGDNTNIVSVRINRGVKKLKEIMKKRLS